jgi:hypothetical protein
MTACLQVTFICRLVDSERNANEKKVKFTDSNTLAPADFRIVDCGPGMAWRPHGRLARSGIRTAGRAEKAWWCGEDG